MLRSDNSEKIVVPVYEGEEKFKEEIQPEKPDIKRVEMSGAKKKKFSLGKASKAEKKSLIFISFVLAFIFASAVFLTLISVKTDAFENKQEPTQAVSLVTGLTDSECALLEQHFQKGFTFYKAGFDRDTFTSKQLISLINLNDSGNFFYTVSGLQPVKGEEADPFDRFYNEDEQQYNYYVIKEADLDKVIESFSLNPLHAENAENYYYFDGYYYFKFTDKKSTTPIVKADITNSKKVSDGSYYVECKFSADGTDATKMLYFITQKTVDEATGAVSFTVNKSSAKPLFNSTGKAAENNVTAKYKMKTETIECYTSDRTLMRKYVVEYPVFSGDSSGEVNANRFYEDMLAVYRLNASSAQKDYEDFIAKGGAKEDLPYTQTITSEVTFDDENRLSFVQYITSYSPVLPEVQEETTGEAQDDYYYYNEEETQAEPEQTETVKLPEVKAEAYTFDKTTGEYVSKDDILGKNYLVISEILYRIYNGYDYSNVASEIEENSTGEEDYYEDDYYYGYDYYSEEDYYDDSQESDIPTDKDGLGVSIYESAWALTKGGVTFYYVSGTDIRPVTIPTEEAQKLLDSFKQQSAAASSTEAVTSEDYDY